jgi:HlyD family secretion protein
MIKNWMAALLGVTLLALPACQPKTTHPGAYQGIVELDERVLAFEVGGRVETLPVQRGQALKAHDVIATLDDGLERTARASREQEADAARSQVELLKAGTRKEEIAAVAAQIRAARASESLLRKNLERERMLLAKGVSTQTNVDELDARLRAAVADRQALQQKQSAMIKGARPQEIDTAEAHAAAADKAVKLEDERLERHTLRTLHDGTVLDVHIEAGEVVAPGAPIATIADINHPYADVFVPEGHVDGIRVGSAATVHVDATKKTFSGHVEDVARRTEFTPRFLFSERERPNRVIRVRVRIDDPGHRLHAGVPAFVDIAPAPEGQPQASTR